MTARWAIGLAPALARLLTTLLPTLLPTRLMVVLAAALMLPPAARAGSLAQRFCDVSTPLSATQQDRLLRFAAIAKDLLQESGAEVVVVARSGLDLARFGVRYSHAGFSLRESELGPWAVRQLYYDCDEGRPRVFDQGLTGFVAGSESPDSGYLKALLLPPASAQAVQQAVHNKALALRLLAARYSANAFAHSLQYQNCNQWLVELLAAAWGGLQDGPDLRAQAQAWLALAAYAPQGVNVNSHLLMALAPLIPWIHLDDHPMADLQALQMRTTLPADIETFLRQREPTLQRLELCFTTRHVVARRDGAPLADGCVPEAGDRVYPLD